MIKTGLLSVLFLAGGLLVKAQSTDNQKASSDTTHRHGMHQGWRGRPDGNGSQAWGQGRQGDHRGPSQGFQAHRGAMTHHRGFGGVPPVRYTPEQRKQVLAINSDYHRKQADLYKQDNLTLGAYKTQLIALQKERKTKLQALLTPEQVAQIDRWKQNASENQQVMAAARLERLKIHLQLSDDQTAKIKTQQEAFRDQLKAVRNNTDLLPDQKREQMQALFSKQKDAMASILTPDQQAKLKDMHGRFGGR